MGTCAVFAGTEQAGLMGIVWSSEADKIWLLLLFQGANRRDAEGGGVVPCTEKPVRITTSTSFQKCRPRGRVRRPTPPPQWKWDAEPVSAAAVLRRDMHAPINVHPSHSLRRTVVVRITSSSRLSTTDLVRIFLSFPPSRCCLGLGMPGMQGRLEREGLAAKVGHAPSSLEKKEDMSLGWPCSPTFSLPPVPSPLDALVPMHHAPMYTATWRGVSACMYCTLGPSRFHTDVVLEGGCGCVTHSPM